MAADGHRTCRGHGMRDGVRALTSTSPNPAFWWLLPTSQPRASVSPAEPWHRCPQGGAAGLGMSGVPVPAHEAGSPRARAVVHLHEVEAAVPVRLQAEVVEVQVDDVAQGHRDLPEAQLRGGGAAGDTREAGQGHPPALARGRLPSSLPALTLTVLPSHSIPSLTCWCGYGWGWFGVDKCPSKAVSGPPHSGGTHTYRALPLPLSPPSISPLPAHPRVPRGLGAAGGVPPLCFRLQLASSLLSVQSWKPSHTKPSWRHSPWSHKCSSQAQLSARGRTPRMVGGFHRAPSAPRWLSPRPASSEGPWQRPGAGDSLSAGITAR